jgi:hypothetical protein
MNINDWDHICQYKEKRPKDDVMFKIIFGDVKKTSKGINTFPE